MRKVKLIVHETYQGKRKSEDVFAAVFLSNATALTPNRGQGDGSVVSLETTFDSHPTDPK